MPRTRLSSMPSMTLQERIESSLSRSEAKVFLRKEFDRFGGYDQVGRALRGIIAKGLLVKAGYGIYVKAKKSSITGNPVPVAPPIHVRAPPPAKLPGPGRSTDRGRRRSAGQARGAGPAELGCGHLHGRPLHPDAHGRRALRRQFTRAPQDRLCKQNGEVRALRRLPAADIEKIVDFAAEAGELLPPYALEKD